MKKSILVFILIFSATVFAQTKVYAQQKIAVVSLQRALNEVEEGKKAKAAIQTDLDAKKKQLESLKTDIKKGRDDLEKQKAVLAKEAMETKAQELQGKLVDLQQKAMQYENELKQKEADSVQKILLALRNVVIEMAKEAKYDMVFENSTETVLYAPTAVDITPDLIKKYNASPPKK